MPPSLWRRWWWAAALAAVIAVGVAATAGYLLLSSDGSSSSDTLASSEISAAGAKLVPGLTESQLKSVDKVALFYAVLRKAALAPLVQTRSENTGATRSVQDAGFDYRTKQFSYAADVYDSAGKSLPYRCIAGQAHYYVGTWRKADDNKRCQLSEVRFGVSDGFNAGGLNQSQADKFVAALQAPEDFVRVNGASVVDRAGKPYVRFAVELRPVKSSDGEYWGLQHLGWAFGKTGLDPTSHPYDYAFDGRNGAKAVIYVSPDSGLPAYSDWVETGAVVDGKPVPLAEPRRRRVEYAFPAQLPQWTTKGADPLKLNWPAEAS